MFFGFPGLSILNLLMLTGVVVVFTLYYCVMLRIQATTSPS